MGVGSRKDKMSFRLPTLFRSTRPDSRGGTVSRLCHPARPKVSLLSPLFTTQSVLEARQRLVRRPTDATPRKTIADGLDYAPIPCDRDCREGSRAFATKITPHTNPLPQGARETSEIASEWPVGCQKRRSRSAMAWTHRLGPTCGDTPPRSVDPENTSLDCV